MTLYDDLGVSEDADSATIKRAYRKRAKAAHPDAGGSSDEFTKLSRAYLVLSNPAKRAEYDETGSYDERAEGEAEAAVRSLVAQFIARALADADLDHTDIIAKMQADVRNGRANIKQAIAENKRLLTRVENLRKRLKLPKDAKATDPFTMALDTQERGVNEAISLNEHQLEINDQITELLKGYSYVVDSAPQGMTAWDLVQQMRTIPDPHQNFFKGV